ncbi:FkbM family methyltransferase [Nostoc sp. CENA67]|uniref:FkbM family methyltransferase n=1 Tax=Amazonocrinis nigriterrae CENA67 TaxID=2794033 RepID=A0A8J7HUZ9_9NOST|nr:FkbM family methyltransferase [Amazonocrinis nigriterrae]MBH8563900.1 FkbM family methyltransferase [Amazonocrinis nigriterrae CENA67]
MSNIFIKQIKKIIKKTAFFDKYYYPGSYLHHIYTAIFESHLIERDKKALQFNQSLLVESNLVDTNNLVFDIGANVGLKAEIYSQLGCKVIVVEPDPRNVKVLRKRFNKNKQVTIVDKAVSSKVSVEKIYTHLENPALSTFSSKWRTFLATTNNRNLAPFSASPETYEIQTTTLDSLIHEFGIPIYIKIDVEGYELEVLKGLSSKVKLVSFESNLPEFIEETIESISYLFQIENKALFNYVLGDTKNFELDSWLDHRGIIDLIQSTNLRYMEIYCKME